MTQVQLVAAVRRRGGDLSQPQLSAIEKDEVERPGALLELAAVLGTTAADLLGKPFDVVAPSEGPQVPVRSYVGAGDEIFAIEEDEPIDYTPAPPGMEDAEALLVRGRSMVPLYHDGDLLFHRRLEIDPLRLRDEVVITQIRSGKRYVKLLQPGTKRGRFRLVSFNAAHPPLEDQALVWVSPILWVRKKVRL